MNSPAFRCLSLPLPGLLAALALPAHAVSASATSPPANADPAGQIAAAQAQQAAPDTGAPPAMQRISAGAVRLGTPHEEIRALSAEHPHLLHTLAAESAGQDGHILELDAFFVGITEVTGEQYAAFVSATGQLPPMSWAAGPINAAAQEFTHEQAERRQAAREAGVRNPERLLFDRFDWWKRNGSSVDWVLPPGAALLPVTGVSYAEAEAYAAWIGQRLPTETEWMAAAGRGEHYTRYAWGDDWSAGMAVTSEDDIRAASEPVGSRAEGASEHEGGRVYDLGGNVWEWTSSPYTPPPGYDADQLAQDLGRRPVPSFDANERVVKGGSYANDAVAARVGSRQGQGAQQQLDLIGFRCAADPKAGRTHAGNLVAGLRGPLRTAEPLAPERTLGRDRTRSSPGSSTVPGYRVPTGYEHVIFVPVSRIDAASGPALTRATCKEGPRDLGVLSTSVEVLEPALQPGTYRVAYRGPGKDRRKRRVEDKSERIDLESSEDSALRRPQPVAGTSALPHEVDESQPQLLFIDANGDLAAAQEIVELEFEALDRRAPDPRGRVELRENAPPTRPTATLTLEAWISAGRHKICAVPIALQIAPGTIDASWRE